MEWVLLVSGLVALILGAEGLVRGGVGLARRLGVSPALIGVTIVAWGTSTPELVVSVDAALKGIDGIAVGNVVGSNIANVLLILGLAAAITPIAVDPRAVRRDVLASLGAIGLFIGVALTAPFLTPWHGVAFLGLLVMLTVGTWLHDRANGTPSAALHAAEAEEVATVPRNAALAATMVLGGVGLLVLGAHLLVEAAVTIARGFGVSEVVIGLTLVAVGTSLPELVTSLVAALRRHSDVALGNVLGSNVYNILAILGVASLVAPVSIPAPIARTDMWVMLAAAVAVMPAMLAGKVGRALALGMLAGYAAYIALLVRG
ncbi:calcium/sodium antiporter [Elioraea tepidiphila]|jgi:cation:H+ antiporter|uniref:calcium/sodium antiporter n=1 Tax=Elioraea tepidiphila TaxID=457934 RepID=UPI00037134C7|nr:calcium/sodium antiporter [Elioraea tepidiphila]